MKKQQTIVKVNETNSISVVKFEDGTYSIAHLQNGEYSEAILNDPKETKYDDEMVEMVQDLACEIIMKELPEYDFTFEADSQLIVETFSYNVWVAVSFDGSKLSYGLSTISTFADQDHEDKNIVERKTFKGLANYLKRFDK